MGLLSRLAGRGVGPTEAQALVAQGAVLVDVRERSEWIAGRAPNAVHMPLGGVAGQVDRLPQDRQVVVVCRSGNRSAQATSLLRRAGLDAVNLDGGMRAWAAAGLPVVADGRKPGRVA